MKEDKISKFTGREIQQFAVDTETELHELFRDVGMKYKAKYRSLMFNIKDRKNLTLWEKICNKTITPQQLVSWGKTLHNAPILRDLYCFCSSWKL